MPKRSYLTNLTIAEELFTGITDEGESVDVMYLDFTEAFDSMYHLLLIKKVGAMRIPPKINRRV